MPERVAHAHARVAIWMSIAQHMLDAWSHVCVISCARDTGIIRDRVRAHLSHDPCVVSSSFVLRMCVPSGGGT